MSNPLVFYMEIIMENSLWLNLDLAPIQVRRKKSNHIRSNKSLILHITKLFFNHWETEKKFHSSFYRNEKKIIASNSCFLKEAIKLPHPHMPYQSNVRQCTYLKHWILAIVKVVHLKNYLSSKLVFNILSVHS